MRHVIPITFQCCFRLLVILCNFQGVFGDVAKRSAALKTEMGSFENTLPGPQLRVRPVSSTVSHSLSSLAESVCNQQHGVWMTPAAKCFFTPNVTGTWHQARGRCNFYGGVLASIESAEENQVVFELYKRSAYHKKSSMWIGYSDHSEEGKWSWLDGATSNYTNWTVAQPNDYKGQDCAAMWNGRGEWSDLGCDDVLPFVCAVSNDTAVRELQKTSVMKDVGDARFWVPANTAQNWTDAEMHCSSQGGHLASIRSAEENQVVQELFVISGARELSVGMWIGASDDAAMIDGVETATWKWSDGSAFDFSRWEGGEPSRACSEAACFVLHEEKLSYAQARSTCREAGGEIATVVSEESNAFLSDMRGSVPEIWLGLAETESSAETRLPWGYGGPGEWVHPNGNQLSYFNWAANQPDNWEGLDGTGEHCASMKAGATWRDVKCSKKLPFVCFHPSFRANRCARIGPNGQTWLDGDCDQVRPFVCSLTISETSTVQREEKNTSSFHFFVPAGTAKSWKDAETHCKSHGAHLASIRSAEDNEIVHELFVSSGAREESRGMWIGASDDAAMIDGAANFRWKWSDGSAFDFSTWDDGQPSAIECTPPASHEELVDRCFLRHDKPMLFREAQAVCREGGGDIASVTSPEENEFLTSLWEDFDTEAKLLHRSFYIGLKESFEGPERKWEQSPEEQARLGTWRHPNGSLVTYFNWAPGEPNLDHDWHPAATGHMENPGECVEVEFLSGMWRDLPCGEPFRKPFVCSYPRFRVPKHCAQMGQNGRMWSDGECDEAKPFVCAAPLLEAVQRVERVSSSFHFFVPASTVSTWSDAEAECDAHGGHLASIRSVEDNEIVNDLFTRSGAREVYGGMWIGASDEIDGAAKGTWQWSDGSAICGEGSAAGPPSLETEGAGGHCGAMTRHRSTWSAFDCLQAQPFVCAVPHKYSHLLHKLQLLEAENERLRNQLQQP